MYCITSTCGLLFPVFDDDESDNSDYYDNCHDYDCRIHAHFSFLRVLMERVTGMVYLLFFFLTTTPVPTAATATSATTITAGFITFPLSIELCFAYI